MTLSSEEIRSRNRAYKQKSRLKKLLMKEGCGFNYVPTFDAVDALVDVMHITGLTRDEAMNQLILAGRDILYANAAKEVEEDAPVVTKLQSYQLRQAKADLTHLTKSDISDPYIFLLRKKYIHNGDASLEADATVSNEKTEDDMLTPYTLDTLTPKKVKAKQTKAKRKDAGQDVDPILIETATTIAGELLAMIRREMPDFKKGVEIDVSRWKGPIMLMIERDGRDPKEMSAIIDWIGKHSDWDVRTVLGTDKFRKQYDRLAISYRQWVRNAAKRKEYEAKKDARKRSEVKQTQQTDALALKTQMFLAEQERRIAEYKAKVASGEIVVPVVAQEGNIEGGNVSRSSPAVGNMAGSVNSVMAKIMARATPPTHSN